MRIDINEQYYFNTEEYEAFKKHQKEFDGDRVVIELISKLWEDVSKNEEVKTKDMKIKFYRPKAKVIPAIRYDGTEKMALEIENSCCHSWVEYDEGMNFCGLQAKTQWGIENHESQYVHEGDYLVKFPRYYVLVDADSFEGKYEEIPNE